MSSGMPVKTCPPATPRASSALLRRICFSADSTGTVLAPLAMDAAKESRNNCRAA